MTFLPLVLLLPLTIMAFRSVWVVRAKASWVTLLAIFVYSYFRDLGALSPPALVSCVVLECRDAADVQPRPR